MADDVARPSKPPRQRPPMRLIVGGIAAVLVLWFAIANWQRVTIDYIIFERESRLFFVILGSALLGALAGALLRRARRRDRRDND
jgi:uncharacterized integral membrane protein